VRALAWVAQKPPSTLNTATSPISRTDPGGTSLIRNSFFFIPHLHERSGSDERSGLCEPLDELEGVHCLYAPRCHFGVVHSCHLSPP